MMVTIVILGSLLVASLGTTGFYFLRWIDNRLEIARLKKRNEETDKRNAEAERKHSEEMKCLRSENSHLRQKNSEQKMYLQNTAVDRTRNQR